MKNETLYKLDQILSDVDEKQLDALAFCIAVVGTLIALPFLLIYEFGSDVYWRMKGYVRDKDTNRWISKTELARKETNRRIRNRELPLVTENHVARKNTDPVFVFEQRKLVFPYSQLVYVETKRCEKIRRFMEDDAEWLDNWQQWYGYDIAEYDAEDIKEGMFYPQDFAVFRHGFLCYSGRLMEDKESGLWGCVYRYYEIDPDSKIPIREQMERMIREIYKEYRL